MTRAQLQAFIDGCESGSIATKRAAVYNLTRRARFSLDALQTYLPNMRMATISGRVSELLDMGLLREWKAGVFEPVVDVEEAVRLSEERSRAKYEKWVKLGQREGYFERYTRDFWQS